MSIHRKHWKKEEKLAALEYARKEGYLKASKEYGVSQTSLYKWRDKLEAIGEGGLDKPDLLALHRELQLLLKENKQLKEVVAEQVLAMKIKEELLKKTNR